jgi:hypothetical protein
METLNLHRWIGRKFRYDSRMSRIFRNLIIFIVVCLCLGVIAFVFELPTLEKKAREEIVAILSEKLNAHVELKSVKLHSIWPLGLRVQALKVTPNTPNYKLQMDLVILRYHYFPPAYVEVSLEKPFFELVGEPPKQGQAPAVTGASGGGQSSPVEGYLSGLGFELNIKEGVVAWKKDDKNDYRVGNIQLVVEKSKLLNLNDPFKFKFSSEVHYTTPYLAGITTLKAESKDLRVSPTAASSENTQVELGGLVLRASGKSDFEKNQHNWRVLAQIDDLQKLPKPPDVIPARNWKGKVFVDTTIDKSKDETSMQGRLKFEKVSMDLNLEAPEAKAKGPASFDAEAQFRMLNGAYEIKDAHLTADLSPVEFQYKDIFKKVKAVPLNFSFKGSWVSESLTIEQLAMQLFTLKAQASGSMGIKNPGKIDWQTEPITLGGWESLILPLAGTPLEGQMELRGTLSGSVTKREAMQIEVSKFLMKAIKGTIKYKSADGKFDVKGPFTVNAEGHASIAGKDVKNAALVANADLSGVDIKDAGVFEKKSSENLQVSVSAKHQGNDIAIEKSEINLPFAVFHISGKIHDPLDPDLTLAIGASFPNLDTLKARMPMLKETPITGQTTAQINLRGKMGNGEPWFKWPMKVTGSVKYVAQTVVLPTPKEEKGGAGGAQPGAAAPPPTAFLQRGALTEQLDLTIDAIVGKLQKDKLVLESNSVKGRIAQGKFMGTISGRGFGGGMTLKNLTVPLLDPDPVAITNVHFDGIKVESLLEFLQPAFKEAARGPANGDVYVESLLPGSPKFLPRLVANGHIGSNNIWINTTSLSQMINDQVSKVPGVPKNAIKLDPLEGKLDSNFKLNNQKAEPLSIDAFDKNGSEVHLSGSASLDKTVNLNGEFRWANAPLTGCLKEGNADNKGRVVVPVSLKGNATSPSSSWSIATNVLTEMGKKALKCEGMKALKSNVGDAVPGELGKALKGILGK